MFGPRLAEPDLWHLNRRSVSTAFAVGLFLGFFPVPGQMVIAAAAALWLRCNLPLSVALVWISNPVTIPPLFFFAYKLGAWVLQVPPEVTHLPLSWDWLLARAEAIWAPLLVGSLICGLVAALIGFTTVHVLWRWHVVQRWERRRALRRMRRREVAAAED
ncbi:MAG TPA: DUF2062 domain-containing protein [Pseudomonadales bacterium]|nr:DUF2062 domain-containing protein [Pseudomonadales bacterium]